MAETRQGFKGTVLGFLLLCLCLMLPLGIYAQSDGDPIPPKPEPAVYVHDYSGWLTPAQKNSLEQKLRAYWDTTSTQIVVMIRPDLGAYDKASYAFELGNRWGIGRKDKNNGVVVLIKSEAPDRGIFIATGYGTEGALPDVKAGHIIRNTMAPFFRQEQYYDGINAGLDEIIGALSGEFTTAEPEQLSGWETLMILLFVLLVVALIVGSIIYNMKKLGKWITKGGSGNKRDGGGWGGWGGGGGWSSGGGSWGGGGGGGSWGGGGSFGGGSFGGGGAGGNW